MQIPTRLPVCTRWTVLAMLALVILARRRRARSTGRGRSNDPADRRESTTSKPGGASGSRHADIVLASEPLGIPGRSDRRQARPRRSPTRAFRRCSCSCGRRAATSSASNTSRSTTRQTARLAQRHRVQRHPLLGSDCRSTPTLDWKAYRVRLRVRLHRQEPRLRRLHLRGQVHRRARSRWRRRSSTSSRARAAPIPAIGGIGRFYVVPNISVTGEVTGFKIPDSVDEPTTTRTTSTSTSTAR